MFWLILVLILFILVLFYFVNIYLDYSSKKKKLLKYVDKKVCVVIGKKDIADVKISGTLRYDVNYIGYQTGKAKFYIQNKSLDKGKIKNEEYLINIFDFKYLFFLSCNE